VIEGVRAAAASLPDVVLPYTLAVRREWTDVSLPGPPVGALRGAWAEEHVLVEGALAEAGVDRAAIVCDERAANVLLDTCATGPDGAVAGAAVDVDRGEVQRVRVRVAAGDPLDEVVLRSYATGAVHMALGWVFTESIAVDPSTGEVHDLTIRSFGIVRPRAMPPVEIEIVDDPGPPRARSSDAVFAAVAAAAWNAVARVEGTWPETFPARDTRAGRALRK
jgi:CO/xanthine dehydrogenase Mo-binding subunit